MILFLLLLIVAGALVAVYAAQNTATHDVTLWQWHWSAVPDWVPVVLTAAVIGALFLLYMLYSGMVHGVRVGSMRRRVSASTALTCAASSSEKVSMIRSSSERVVLEKGLISPIAGSAASARSQRISTAMR